MYSCIPLLLPKWGNNVGSNLNLGRNSLAPSHYPAFENERDALSPPDAFWDKLYPKKHPPFFFFSTDQTHKTKPHCKLPDACLTSLAQKQMKALSLLSCSSGRALKRQSTSDLWKHSQAALLEGQKTSHYLHSSELSSPELLVTTDFLQSFWKRQSPQPYDKYFAKTIQLLHSISLIPTDSVFWKWLLAVS